MMTEVLWGIPLWAFMLSLVPLVLLQGSWLFKDARRRGKWPWFWGLWGLIQVPTPFVLYMLLIVRPWRRREDQK